MSYVLHLWADIPAASVAAADQLVGELGRLAAPENPRFLAFARALTAMYPDFDELEARGDDPESSVWTDSPFDGRSQHAAYAFGVVSDHVSEELLMSIAHAAADQGLWLFDPQAGRLYRPNRSVLDAAGWRHWLIPRPTAPAMPRPADIAHRVLQALMAAAPGWQWHQEGSSPAGWCLWRRNGEITLWLACDVNSGPVSTVDFRLGFAADSIQMSLDRLLPALGAWRRQQQVEQGRQFNDAFALLADVFRGPDLDALGLTPRVLLYDEAALSAWIARFATWFGGFPQGVCAGMADLSAVSRWFGAAGRREAFAERIWGFATLPGMLVATHRANSSERDAWIALARECSRRERRLLAGTERDPDSRARLTLCEHLDELANLLEVRNRFAGLA